MFTTEEDPLLSGTADDIEAFIDSERCMIVDWRSTEDEAIDEAIRFLPAGSLTYEMIDLRDDSVHIRIRYCDREETVSLPFKPQNNFRVLLHVWRLLQPDYDIKIFRCWDCSDTYAFLLRATEWWTAYRAAYPEQYAKVFRDITDLNELWQLESPRKPWWKFW